MVSFLKRVCIYYRIVESVLRVALALFFTGAIHISNFRAMYRPLSPFNGPIPSIIHPDGTSSQGGLTGGISDTGSGWVGPLGSLFFFSDIKKILYF